jgi:hypothetical protein
MGEYQSLTLKPLGRDVSIGVVPVPTASTDNACQRLIKATANSLSRCANVVLPCPADQKVDYLVEISPKSEYKGSFWNWFPINWPGFLIFTPAWNGYAYKANYDFDMVIRKPEKGEQIASFSVPIHLKVRHADIDRTWTEIGWLEWGVIPLVVGPFFTAYDPDVTDQAMDKTEVQLGEYLAEKIISRIHEKR